MAEKDKGSVLARKLSAALGISVEEAEAMVGNGGLSATSGAIQQQSVADQFEQSLAEAALEVSGVNVFNYSKQGVPSWVPDALRSYVGSDALNQVYDPYEGFLDQQGDERVYQGQQFNADVFFGDITGWGVENFLEADDKIDVNTKEGRKENLRSDRANKVEAQLGNDPSQQTTAGTGDRKKKSDKTITRQQAVNLPLLWEEDQVQSAMKQMREAGINVTTFDQLTQVWGSLVDRASSMYSLSKGKRKVTPWDVLELSKREAVSAGNFTNYESGTKTTTAKSVTEIDEGDSWQVLQSTLSQLLGRDPTDQELRDYTYRMNSLAAKNPAITETITRFKAGEAVGSDQSTTGGFDAGDMAQEAYEDAQDDPDYGAYQAASTYFNAALGALGAIGDV